MEYKTVVLKYNPRAKKMAEEVEKTANEYAKEGWNLLTFSVTLSAKAILVFEKPDLIVNNGKIGLLAFCFYKFLSLSSSFCSVVLFCPTDSIMFFCNTY